MQNILFYDICTLTYLTWPGKAPLAREPPLLAENTENSQALDLMSSLIQVNKICTSIKII